MSTTESRHDRPGDLGRRIAFRRRELGLSSEQLASRTGMASDYLDRLERYHANLSAASLLRLARALETTVDTLLGAGHPPGGRTRSSRALRLRRIEAGECMRLLSEGGVGRLVFVTDHGPEAVPVNFAMVDGAVVFRTAPGTVIARQVGRTVGFEVDRMDEALSQGWSVLLSGRARRVVEPAVVARLRATVEPWPGDDRHAAMVIDPSRITGRRVGP